MPGPDDPRVTSGWGWTGRPAAPWWREGARLLGVDDDLDRAGAAVRQAGEWLNGILPAAPQFKPEFEERFAADQAAMDQRRTANTAAVGNFARRIMGSAPVQGLTETVASQFRPTDQTNQMIDMAKEAVSARGQQVQSALGGSSAGASGPAWTGTEPLAATLGFLGETLPHFALDVARDSSTPGGALSNIDLPVAQALPFLAKAGGAGLAALPPGFYSKVERIAEKIPAKGVAPNKLKAMLQGGGATAEELGHRKVNEFITQRLAEPNRPITQAEFAAHLGAHPLPDVQFHTQGGPPPPEPAYKQYQTELSKKYNVYGGFNPDEITPEEQQKLAALWKEFEEGPEPPERHAPSYDVNYPNGKELQLPGGQHYGESLTSVPQPAGTGRGYTGGHYGHIPNVIGSARTTERFLPATTRPLPEIEAIIQQAIGAKSPSSIASGAPETAVKKGLITADEAAAYGHSKGFTNYPQPPGRKGVFGEEFQGDLHREGRTSGYHAPPPPEQAARRAELRQQREEVVRLRDEADQAETRAYDAYIGQLDAATRRLLPPEFADAIDDAVVGPSLTREPRAYAAWRTARDAAVQTADVQAASAAYKVAEDASKQATDHSYAFLRETRPEWNTINTPGKLGSVPDMPFKGDEWLDLELKKQLLRVANDPEASWFGWSGGKTIADRYNLAKYVDTVRFEPEDAGDYTVGALVGYKNGRELFRQENLTHEELKKYLTKSQAEELSNQVRTRGEAQAEAQYRWSIDEHPDGGYQITDPTGAVVPSRRGGPARFGDLTDAQDRLDELQAAERHAAAGDHPQLTGEQLVGAKWPFQTYDETTKRKVEKILQPFGVPVEPLAEVPNSGKPGQYQWHGPAGSPVGPQFSSPELARTWRPGWESRGYTVEQVAQPKPGEPGWITNFTPEQKKRISDEGFSFMSMLPPAAVGGAAAAGAAAGGDPNDDPNQQASNFPFDLGQFAQVGMAALPFAPIKLPKSAGALANAVKRGEPGMHPLRADMAERVARLTDFAETFPRLSNWRGMNDPAYLRAFDNDAVEAGRHLRAFAASSPSTAVPDNAREAAALQAWRLLNPGQDITHAQTRSLRGQPLGNASSKYQNVNDAWHDRVMGRSKYNDALKVESFGNFMHDQFGLVGHPMRRRSRPADIQWGADRSTPLIALPHDMHMLYGTGGQPQELLDDEWDPLRERLSKWEGLIHPETGGYLKGNQGGFTNKDLYDRVTWSLADTLANQRPGMPLQQSFGRFWTGAQANKLLEQGKKVPFAGGLLDIYGNVGLLEPGAMNNPDAIYKALEGRKDWYNLGWGPGK